MLYWRGAGRGARPQRAAAARCPGAALNTLFVGAFAAAAVLIAQKP